MENGSGMTPGWLVFREVLVEEVCLARFREKNLVVKDEDAVNGEREEGHVVDGKR